MIDLAVGQQATTALFGERIPHFVVHRTSGTSATIRTIRADVASMPDFAHDYSVDLPYPINGPLALQLYVDRGLVELCASDGLVWITNLFFPEHPAGAVSITAHEELNMSRMGRRLLPALLATHPSGHGCPWSARGPSISGWQG